MTTLVKEAINTYIPGDPGQPGDPGSPGRPAWVETVVSTTCEVSLSPQCWFVGGELLCSPFPTIPDVTCHDSVTQVYHQAEAPRPSIPAIPSTDSQILTNLNSGWNAWAWSDAYLWYGQGVSWTALDGRATLVGLAVIDNSGLQPKLSNLPHALLRDSNGVHIITNGVVTGTLTNSSSLYIETDGAGNVKYGAGTTSTVASLFASTDAVSIVAMLYEAGDSIKDMAIYDVAVTPTAPVTGAIDATITAQIRLPSVNLFQSVGTGFMSFAVPLIDVAANDGGIYTPPAVARINIVIPPVTFAAVSASGKDAEITVEIPLFEAHVWQSASAKITAEIPMPSAYVESADTDRCIGILAIYGFFDEVAQEAGAPAIYTVTATASGTLTPIFSGTRIMVSSFLASLQASALVSGIGIYKSSFVSTLNASAMGTGVKFGQGAVDSELVLVTDLDTGATVQYESYGFNSYFDLAGTYYGVADDGIFLLEGDTDNGDLIEAFIQLPKSILGTSAMKGTFAAYAAVKSDQAVMLKVVVDESEEYTYEARSSSTVMKTHRIDIGRGLRGNQWTFTLMNKDGSDFEMQSLELIPLSTGRRV